MSGNLISIVNELASLKQLDKSKITQIIAESLHQAISKKLLPESELEIITNFETNQMLARFKRIVVPVETNNLGEMSLEEAHANYDDDAQLGDIIEVEMNIGDFEPRLSRMPARLSRNASRPWRKSAFCSTTKSRRSRSSPGASAR
jgi:hypothetical protein